MNRSRRKRTSRRRVATKRPPDSSQRRCQRGRATRGESSTNSQRGIRTAGRMFRRMSRRTANNRINSNMRRVERDNPRRLIIIGRNTRHFGQIAILLNLNTRHTLFFLSARRCARDHRDTRRNRSSSRHNPAVLILLTNVRTRRNSSKRRNSDRAIMPRQSNRNTNYNMSTTLVKIKESKKSRSPMKSVTRKMRRVRRRRRRRRRSSRRHNISISRTRRTDMSRSSRRNKRRATSRLPETRSPRFNNNIVRRITRRQIRRSFHSAGSRSRQNSSTSRLTHRNLIRSKRRQINRVSRRMNT